MIEVGVSEDDGVNLARRQRRVRPVALPPLLLPLEKSAIHQDLEARFAARDVGGVDQVLGAGDGAGCAQKLDVGHGSLRRLQTRDSTAARSSCGIPPRSGGGQSLWRNHGSCGFFTWKLLLLWSASGTLPSFTFTWTGGAGISMRVMALAPAGTCRRLATSPSLATATTGTSAPALPVFSTVTVTNHPPSSNCRGNTVSTLKSGSPRSRYTQSSKNHSRSRLARASSSPWM